MEIANRCVKVYLPLAVADGQLCELCSHEPNVPEHESRATDEAVPCTNDGEGAADVADVGEQQLAGRAIGISDKSDR